MTRIALAVTVTALGLVGCATQEPPVGADLGRPDAGPKAKADAGVDAGVCAATGAACQTSHNCCDGTCGPYFTCEPFPAAIPNSGCHPVTAACTSSGDCCSGHCNALGFCSNGFPVKCQTDQDCPYATSCLLCINECVYPANGACDTMAPCPCGYTCLAGTCASAALDGGTNACAANDDCPSGQECNPLSFQCQYPMCTTPSGPGLPGGGFSAPTPCTPDGGAAGCAEGTACVSYSGSYVCLRPCLTNLNCGLGQVLCGPIDGEAHACIASCSTACASSADCPQDLPVCEAGNCIRPGC